MVSQLGSLGQHDHDGVQGLLARGDNLTGGQNESVGALVTQLVAVDQAGILVALDPVNAATAGDVCN